jgi:hypothetical protein
VAIIIVFFFFPFSFLLMQVLIFCSSLILRILVVIGKKTRRATREQTSFNEGGCERGEKPKKKKNGDCGQLMFVVVVD